MGDMKCNEDTINPSYIEKNNKRRPKHDPTNGKKRTEGSNQDGQTVYEILHRNTCQKGPKIQRIIQKSEFVSLIHLST